jgi:hypothetical protein
MSAFGNSVAVSRTNTVEELAAPYGGMENAQFVERPIRVAIYDDGNSTKPGYLNASETQGVVHNNVSLMSVILGESGYEPELLDVQDIQNNVLQPASFDVLVLPDNLPRENITDQIMEFWLGGGGILALDGSSIFLCEMGILPPESEGENGNYVYWEFAGNDFNFTKRHPVSKSYALNDTIDRTVVGDFAWNWTALQSSSIAGDLKKIAATTGNPEFVAVMAFDPSDRGGRIVTSMWDLVNDYLPEMFPLFGDAVEWLAPRPKGRIAFDMSHQPRLGVDTYDTLSQFPGKYVGMRDSFVRNDYTFDKLYPTAEGNLTGDRLEQFDILILVSPDYNYTGAEREAVVNWVENGGGLFVLGESSSVGPSFLVPTDQINSLFGSFSMELNISSHAIGVQTAWEDNHPTTEGTADLRMGTPGYINYTGDAEPIWRVAGGVTVATQPFGNGRVVLAADMNFADGTYIDQDDNIQFLINVANWLTSSEAKVLVYSDTAFHDPNNNTYRGPVAEALNDLGIPFYMTSVGFFLNQSLHLQEWDLVIVDNINYVISGYFDDLLWYLEEGGRLILETWTYSSSFADALNTYIGYDYVGPNFSPPPDIHIWAPDAPIFNNPVEYGADTISTSRDFIFGTECANLTVFENATALGGLSPDASETNATIILGADGRALVNGMLLTMYWSDTDDSAFEDAKELWFNEIAFMMRPIVDSPSDITFEGGSTGHAIVWEPHSWSPAEFAIIDGSSELAGGPWEGAPIDISVDDFEPGVHEVKLTLYDTLGFSESDVVIVTVVDTTPPDINSPADVEFEEATTGNSVEWTCYDLYPDTYSVYVNSSIDISAAWAGGNIEIILDGLEEGFYNLTLVVEDTSGNSASDTVLVTVTPPTGLGGLDTTTIIIIAAAAGGALLIIIIIIIRKRSGGS